MGLGGAQLTVNRTARVGSTVQSARFPGGYRRRVQLAVPQQVSALDGAGELHRIRSAISSQEASVARARVQLNQVQAQIKQIELQVATDVTNAAVSAQSNVERVQAAQAARELAQKQLEAEQSKFEVGMSTNYNVVQAQRDLATAQNNELQAVLNYRKALVELERLQQTTLQNLNVTLIGAGGGGGAATTTTTATTAVRAGGQ